MGDDAHGQGDMPPWLQPVLEQEDEDGFRSDKVRKIVAFGAIGILIVFVIALGITYFGGDSEDRGPVTVESPTGPVREKPADPGGMKVEGRDMEVFDVVSGDKDSTAQEIGKVAEEPVSEIPTDQRSALAEKVSEIADDTPAVEDMPPAVDEKTPSRDAVVDKVASVVEEAREEEKPAVSKPVVQKPAPAVTIPASAFKVQLGAFSKRSTADDTWKAATRKFPSYLGSLTPIFDEIQRSSGGVLHRLRAGPVSGRAEADRICLALKSEGQACMVVKPE